MCYQVLLVLPIGYWPQDVRLGEYPGINPSSHKPFRTFQIQNRKVAEILMKVAILFLRVAFYSSREAVLEVAIAASA